MNLYAILLAIAGVLTATTPIAVFLVKIYKLISGVEKKINGFEENLNNNTLSTYRLVIINEDMPLSERLNAGKKYVEMGGNGEIHVLYDFLCEEYKKNCK